MRDVYAVEDAAYFAHHHILSEDIDPVYPVLRVLRGQLDLGREQALWLTTLYLAYYNLPSAVTAFTRYPTWQDIPAITTSTLKLPTGVERRGLRDERCMRQHLDDYHRLVEHFGNQDVFLAGVITYSGAGNRSVQIQNYERLWSRVQMVKFNGRWAAFKWLELLKDVHMFPITAPDMRLQYSSGPLGGLVLLTGAEPGCDVDRWNRYATQLAKDMDAVWPDEGKEDPQTRTGGTRQHMDWEGLETVLCDFNSMALGRYYVGHDIDQMQEQINAPHVPQDVRNLLWRARLKALPRHYLGEQMGWNGVDRARGKLYRDTGVIVTRDVDGLDQMWYGGSDARTPTGDGCIG